MLPALQVSEREAAEAARKAARQCAADRIYDKLRLEKEAALRAQVGACLSVTERISHTLLLMAADGSAELATHPARDGFDLCTARVH